MRILHLARRCARSLESRNLASSWDSPLSLSLFLSLGRREQERDTAGPLSESKSLITPLDASRISNLELETRIVPSFPRICQTYAGIFLYTRARVCIIMYVCTPVLGNGMRCLKTIELSFVIHIRLFHLVE